MKIPVILLVLTHSLITFAYAQENCLDADNLVSLDEEWERALKESDVNFLETILAEDFIWIHNHASTVDTRDSLVKRASDPGVGATGNPKSRVSRDVKW